MYDKSQNKGAVSTAKKMIMRFPSFEKYQEIMSSNKGCIVAAAALIRNDEELQRFFIEYFKDENPYITIKCTPHNKNKKFIHLNGTYLKDAPQNFYRIEFSGFDENECYPEKSFNLIRNSIEKSIDNEHFMDSFGNMVRIVPALKHKIKSYIDREALSCYYVEPGKIEESLKILRYIGISDPTHRHYTFYLLNGTTLEIVPPTSEFYSFAIYDRRDYVEGYESPLRHNIEGKLVEEFGLSLVNF